VGFPIFALLACGFALFFPAWISEGKPLIIPMLGLIMFSMGLTQSLKDFAAVFRQPKGIAVGIFLQYGSMPLLAWLIAFLLNLPADLAVGLILVGCCAGGTASNVITYLAKGNVALSISMTLISTFIGILATPFLIQVFAGTLVEVNPLAMLFTIAKIVLIPVVLGIIIRHYAEQKVVKFEPALPYIAKFLIITIIAIVVALNESKLESLALPLVLAVALHNALGLVIGFYGARLFGLDPKDQKTIAIEVGMQNSGLGVALALKFFTPATALPGALFSIWHNLSGSVLAAYWSSRAIKKSNPQEK
jgi:BASS family bile acid:Na+ symporter